MERAVRLYCNEATLCAKALSLCRDDLCVLRVDFRHDHWNIRSTSVCAVIGNNRALCLCVQFLQSLYIVLWHIYCTEYKVYHAGNLFYVCGSVHDDQIFHFLRHWCFHQPTGANSFRIGFACGVCAGSQCYYVEPWVVLQKGCKSLTYHTGCTDNCYIISLFHN